MPLSDMAIRNAKPRDVDYKVADGEGLYLLVKTNGSRLWAMAYRFGGKQKKLSIGPYPAVGLADARQRRAEARKLLASGADPALKKRLDKITAAVSSANTFGAIADEWLKRITGEGSAPATLIKHERMIRMAKVTLGGRPITEITAPEIFELLQRVERSGRLETARRVRTTCSLVFRFAIVTARATQDPCIPLIGATKAPTVTHHAAVLTPAGVAGLMTSINGYDGSLTVRGALRLLALTFVRQSELRWATWSEFDLDGALWSIPAARMKMSNPHLVPLSRQAVEILRELWAARRTDGLVFPSVRSVERAISENTINAALRRLDYETHEMTGHGFRRTASTFLNEQGWNPEWVERQLAHVERNDVRRAYNAAEYLPGRTEMMQRWADWLEDVVLLG